MSAFFPRPQRLASIGLVFLTAVSGLAFAGSTSNGTSFNGTSFNGTSFNGTSFNGVSINGVSINGVSINGVSINGVSANRSPVQERMVSKGSTQAASPAAREDLLNGVPLKRVKLRLQPLR